MQKLPYRQLMTPSDITLENLSLYTCFSDLKDPRSGQGKLHIFFDMICIAICAVLCGANSWVEVEKFGDAQEEWLRTFLKLLRLS